MGLGSSSRDMCSSSQGRLGSSEFSCIFSLEVAFVVEKKPILQRIYINRIEEYSVPVDLLCLLTCWLK